MPTTTKIILINIQHYCSGFLTADLKANYEGSSDIKQKRLYYSEIKVTVALCISNKPGKNNSCNKELPGLMAETSQPDLVPLSYWKRKFQRSSPLWHLDAFTSRRGGFQSEYSKIIKLIILFIWYTMSDLDQQELGSKQLAATFKVMS